MGMRHGSIPRGLSLDPKLMPDRVALQAQRVMEA